MELIQKLICLIGVFCFCFGGSAMNSKSLLLPSMLCIVGGLLVLATYHAYKI